jgi:hypothetical protein
VVSILGENSVFLLNTGLDISRELLSFAGLIENTATYLDPGMARPNDCRTRYAYSFMTAHYHTG